MKPFCLLFLLAMVAGCTRLQPQVPAPLFAPATPKPSPPMPPSPMTAPMAHPMVAAATAAAPAPTNAQVTLTWNASPTPGVTGYRVYQGVGSRIYTNNVDVGNTLSNTISLVRGSSYFFAVTAYLPVPGNAFLESDFSNEVSFTATNRPAPPTLLKLNVDIASGPTPKGPWSKMTNLYVATVPIATSNKFWSGKLITVALP